MADEMGRFLTASAKQEGVAPFETHHTAMPLANATSTALVLG